MQSPGDDPITVRDGALADVAAVLRIYTPYVLHGAATFEEEPPSLDEMARRRDAVVVMQRTLGAGSATAA